MQVFDSSGVYVTTIGETGVSGFDNAHFQQPRRMAVYGNLLYIADGGNHRIQIYNIANPATPVYSATMGVAGQYGSDNSHFNFPEGVTVDSTLIYVADSGNNRVQIFSRTTLAYVATIGTGARGRSNDMFDHPSDVVVDTTGRIYVADQYNSRVQVFNSSRIYQQTIGTTGVPYLTDDQHFNTPHGVAVGPDRSVYILETRGRRLLKLNAAGVLQWTVGEAGQGGNDNQHLGWPEDVDVDGAGAVYVADAGNKRVQIFSAAGQYVATLGTGYGTGQTQFKNPNGVAVTTDGAILVSDQGNHRIQIFDRNRNYVATLGVTGQSGADNAHFNNPFGVDVDEAGRIYVVDWGNHRVQVFDSSRNYLRTIGVTGECGEDFSHLCNPIAVSADNQGRVFVADGWGWRVQVFDAQGRYLTTIGRRDGTNSPQVSGMSTPSSGGVYLAEDQNHRISVFGTPGSPWVQTNINGFGHPGAGAVAVLREFKGKIYAGSDVRGATPGVVPRLYASTDGRTWVGADPGLGLPYNYSITDLVEFNGALYAGTGQYDWDAEAYNGGEVYRTSDGATWETVATGGFGRRENGEIGALAVFNGYIYAGTYGYDMDDNLPAEIWRSATGNAGDWQRVVADGLGQPGNSLVRELAVYDGALYAGISNYAAGGEVWRTTNGTDWTRVATGGLGSGTDRQTVNTLAAFNGALYIGLSGSQGTQVWRCVECTGADWNKATGMFDTAAHRLIGVMGVFDEALYYAVGNAETGLEVWRTLDGNAWHTVAVQGFGDWANTYARASAMTVYKDGLYLGTVNWTNGGEIWQYLSRRVMLPVAHR